MNPCPILRTSSSDNLFKTKIGLPIAMPVQFNKEIEFGSPFAESECSTVKITEDSEEIEP